jgi:hypothetical protein
VVPVVEGDIVVIGQDEEPREIQASENEHELIEDQQDVPQPSVEVSPRFIS